MPSAISTGVGGSSPNLATGQLVPSSAFTSSDQLMPMIGRSAQQMIAQGGQFMETGEDALTPVINHLMKLLSGDPQAINEAILPEARGVMAQVPTPRVGPLRNSPLEAAGKLRPSTNLGSKRRATLPVSKPALDSPPSVSSRNSDWGPRNLAVSSHPQGPRD